MTAHTTFDHEESGAIQPRKRATIDDLEFAATWLENYEGNPEDDRENLISAATVESASAQHLTEASALCHTGVTSETRTRER